MTRFKNTIARIDAANSEDPNTVADGDRLRPAELVYGERMSQTLERLYPNASEALRIAARAQHFRRWTVPRKEYPMDRAGYHRWRNDLKRMHAQWAGDIMEACGYEAGEVERVGKLIRKENLKLDAEAQALEDAACIVFLEHYCADFASKHTDEKLLGILRKTWAKMSAQGQSAALTLPLPSSTKHLITRALEE